LAGVDIGFLLGVFERRGFVKFLFLLLSAALPCFAVRGLGNWLFVAVIALASALIGLVCGYGFRPKQQTPL
jgi:hypothetical protein